MEVHVLKDKVFEKGKTIGFSEMEVYYQHNEKFSCKVFKGEIDNYVVSVEGGLSFRGLLNGKMGYAYTEKVDETSIDMLLKSAKENVEIIDTDEMEIIFEGSPIYQKVDIFAEDLSRVAIEDKVQLIKQMEEAAYNADQRVENVNYCLYEDYHSETMIFNTKGLAKKEQSNVALVYLAVVVKEEEERKTGSTYKLTRNFKDFDYEDLAQEAVDQALSLLGAKSIKSKSYPVLLKNEAASDLLQTFVSVFSAENVQKGRSLLKGKLGEAIASAQISIMDNPLMAEGAASRSFDCEGVATEKTAIVEDGILRSLLHNLKTAQKEGVNSTGHGYKGSYKGTLSISPTNFYIQPGLNTYEDLVASLEEGVIITDLQGLHAGANTVSGDFSLAAHGYYVKEGKVVRPVNQITIAGNFYEVLQEIEAIGNDLKFGMPSGGCIGSPTLKIKSLAIAGE